MAGATLAPPHPDVPPVDSLDVWAALTQPGVPSPRTEVPLSLSALVIGDYKLTLTSGKSNVWCGEEWPMGSTTPAPPCNTELPCLFNLAQVSSPLTMHRPARCAERACCALMLSHTHAGTPNCAQDPYEHLNLASDGSHASILSKLQARMAQLAATKFQTGQDGYTGGFNNCTSNDEYKAAHGGFIGPLCTLGGPPPPPPPAPPPVGGLAISWRGSSSSCLVPRDSAKLSPVGLGACTAPAAHGWGIPSVHTGYVYRLRGMDPSVSMARSLD